MVRGAMVQMGIHPIDRSEMDWNEVSQNDYFFAQMLKPPSWRAEYLESIRLNRDSIGGAEVVAEGVPAGIGAPLYGKLDQDIAGGLMSINAVKGVEIGADFRQLSC
ncbi:MAG: chorismate synthase [Pirellulales bacterium]